MRAALMIVVHESSEMAIQTGFTEYDHVIQALPPNRADHPLDVSSLPGRPGRREHLLDAHRLHPIGAIREVRSILATCLVRRITPPSKLGPDHAQPRDGQVPRRRRAPLRSAEW